MLHLLNVHNNILLSFSAYAGICILSTFVLATLLVPVQKTSPKHYAVLDNVYFLKVLLTLGIVLHHIFMYLNIWNKADLCVEFFFIISGFMLFYTYKATTSVRHFITTRLIRFLPYIFLANLICLFGKGAIDWTRLSSGIFLFSSSPIYPHHAYYMPTWYLVILFWIALLYFILTRIFAKYAPLLVGGICLVSLWTLHYQNSPIESYNLMIPWLTNGFIRGLAGIGIGYCIAVFYKHKNFNIYCKWFFSLLELGLLIYIPLTLFDKSFEISLGSEILYFVLLYVLFLRQQGILSSFFEKPIWRQFAKFTLPVFMTHDIIVPVLIYTDVLAPFAPVFKVFILLIASALTGVFTYYMLQAAQICHRKIFK